MLFRAICIAILACVSLAACADSPNDTVPIPLKDMPGTKDVRELEPEIYGDGTNNISNAEREKRLGKSLVANVGRGVVDRVKGPESGFAVRGVGHTALKNAYSHFHDQKLPQTMFSTNDEISLVFFSYTFGAYVHLDHVERQGTTIKIYYRFDPHLTMEVTSHYAIVPLGKLPVGNYDVKLVQLPMNPKFAPPKANLIDKEAGEMFVCKPFAFSVVSKTQEQK